MIRFEKDNTTFDYPLHHVDNPPSTLRVLVAEAAYRYLDKYEDIKSVLDLGCGDGGLLGRIADPYKDFIGVDFHKENTDYAKTRTSMAEFLTEDITSRRNSASLVILCEVLEHLENPIKLLNELKCDFLIASVPIGETVKRHSPGHLWGYSKKDFKELLGSAGFDILQYVIINGRTQLAVGKKHGKKKK